MDVPAIALSTPSLPSPGLGSIQRLGTTLGAPAGDAIGGFGQALTDALAGISSAQNTADRASVQMAAGEPIDLHEVMLSRETASLQFQLAVQVRNKLVEAYQDVMRMQV